MNKVVPILCMAGIIIAPIFQENTEKITGFLCGILFYDALIWFYREG